MLWRLIRRMKQTYINIITCLNFNHKINQTFNSKRTLQLLLLLHVLVQLTLSSRAFISLAREIRRVVSVFV